MNPIFQKLNYKDQQVLHVLQAPDSFEKALDEMRIETAVKTTLTGAKGVSFFLAFVTRQKEVDELIRKVVPLLENDAVIWFAYPKGTSKKFKCEFNRDNGWKELGVLGFEPVRAVAIDEDWTALRFRRAENIKKMTRNMAITEEGKRRVALAKKMTTSKK